MSIAVESPENIVIVGTGTVGFAKGRALLEHGHRVDFVDSSSTRREELISQGFSCGEDVKLGSTSSIIFVCVPTPASSDGYDFTILRQSLEHIGGKLAASASRHVVVVCSTLSPRTTERVVIPTLEKSSGGAEGKAFDVALVPEFIRTPHALEDSRTPWMTVIGARHNEVRSRLMALLEPFGGEIRVTNELVAAELIKVTHNAYNAAKISFFNEMYRLASAVDVDGHFVAEVVSRSAEGSTNPQYGIRGGSAFSGACLPKDLDGLIAFAETLGVDVPVLEATRWINQTFAAMTLPPVTS
jgi:UDPglucose 6-dehydrogenase